VEFGEGANGTRAERNPRNGFEINEGALAHVFADAKSCAKARIMITHFPGAPLATLASPEATLSGHSAAFPRLFVFAPIVLKPGPFPPAAVALTRVFVQTESFPAQTGFTHADEV
jgi:hypothetical protein